MSAIDSVLLIAFGGPTAPQEIRPFLEIVTRGRRIPPERLEEVAHHYEEMPGGRSPLNELTERQAAGLRRALERDGLVPFFEGARPVLAEDLVHRRQPAPNVGAESPAEDDSSARAAGVDQFGARRGERRVRPARGLRKARRRMASSDE